MSDWFCLLCFLRFRVWFFLLYILLYLVRFWWKGWFFMKRCPLVWCSWRGPLNCLSRSILGKFVEACHNLGEYCLSVRGTLHVEHIGVSSLFRSCEWVIWVWPMRSLESITFLKISSVACLSLTHQRWSLFSIWSSWDLCHLSSTNFLMVGFKSVYGILYWISVWSPFFSFVCSFISMYTNVTGYPSENDAIIF